MLISSHRHTDLDLGHWDLCERIDAVNASRLARGPKLAKALAELCDFAAAGPCYVATSWGKDSVVVAHLLIASGLRLPLVHVAQIGPQENPDNALVRDAFLGRFDVDYHEIAIATGRAQAEGKRTPALEIGIKEAQRRLGTQRWIGGLRASESSTRQLAARRGKLSSCWPIAWWSGADVFAYLHMHDLPIHPAYACTQGGMLDREQIRVSILGGKKGRGWGRLNWERRYYREEMTRIEEAGLL